MEEMINKEKILAVVNQQFTRMQSLDALQVQREIVKIALGKVYPVSFGLVLLAYLTRIPAMGRVLVGINGLDFLSQALAHSDLSSATRALLLLLGGSAGLAGVLAPAKHVLLVATFALSKLALGITQHDTNLLQARHNFRSGLAVLLFAILAIWRQPVQDTLESKISQQLSELTQLIHDQQAKLDSLRY
ncbi:hypothetical protein BASA81_009867 [Batrachochytrium salamandrivorans]|nr:hypothetical protein BASA81_009867 [Batrachochytrium salamandrivorans]